MPPHSDVSNAVRKMKGPGTVFSALLFVATFVLFPYVGMLLRITCSHNPTTDLLFHDQRQRVPTSAQSDYYLDTGEKSYRYLCTVLDPGRLLHVNTTLGPPTCLSCVCMARSFHLRQTCVYFALELRCVEVQLAM